MNEYSSSYDHIVAAYDNGTFGTITFNTYKNKVPIIPPMGDPMEGYDGCTCSCCIQVHTEDFIANYNAQLQKILGGVVILQPGLVAESLTPHVQLPKYDLQDQEVFGGLSSEDIVSMSDEQYLKICDDIAKANKNVSWAKLARAIKIIGNYIKIAPNEWVLDKKWSCQKFHEAMVRQWGGGYETNMRKGNGSSYYEYVHGYALLWKYKISFNNYVSGSSFTWIYNHTSLAILEANKEKIIPFIASYIARGHTLYGLFSDLITATNLPENMQETATTLLNEGYSGETLIKMCLKITKLSERWVNLVKLPQGTRAIKSCSIKEGDFYNKFVKDMDTLSSALNLGVPEGYCSEVMYRLYLGSAHDPISAIESLLNQRRYFELILKGIKAAQIQSYDDITKIFYALVMERPSVAALRNPAEFVRKSLEKEVVPPTNVLGKIQDKIAQRAPTFAKQKWSNQYNKGLKIGWLFKQVLEYMEKKTAEGHTFYIHGRDGEIVYQLARRSGRKINCKFAITSRSLGPTRNNLNELDADYVKYLKRVFPQNDKKAIHLDSGFSGSVPKWFHRSGWDPSGGLVLVGACNTAKDYQLPFVNRQIDGLLCNPDGLAGTYMEDITHRLISPDKWGKLKFNEASGGFWAYIYGIEESIKAEFPEFYNVKKSVVQAAA